MKKSICVDLDATLLQYDGWEGIDHFGPPIPGAREFVAELSKTYNVVIYTTRCSSEINKEAAHLLRNRVRDYLDEEGIYYDHIWTEQGKPICSAIVDDRAVSCRPQDEAGPAAAYAGALAQIRALG